jgi:quercetin 2,3-dioxygenase
MANTILHTAATRGHANHGWLDSHHSFSFASYYNPERMRFGALRVLNDDIVAGGRGFDTHPHDNMEIISIPLKGSLVHKDTLGNTEVIKAGEIQVMSAGTGVFHSEYNADPKEPVSFLQIWLFPDRLNVTPRYGQVKIDLESNKNQLQQVLSPNPDDAGAWIYQQAWFNMGLFDAQQQVNYKVKKSDNGAYVFVISGAVSINGQELNAKDGLGISDVKEISFTTLAPDTQVLIMDVPMI